MYFAGSLSLPLIISICRLSIIRIDNHNQMTFSCWWDSDDDYNDGGRARWVFSVRFSYHGYPSLMPCKPTRGGERSLKSCCSSERQKKILRPAYSRFVRYFVLDLCLFCVFLSLWTGVRDMTRPCLLFYLFSSSFKACLAKIFSQPPSCFFAAVNDNWKFASSPAGALQAQRVKHWIARSWLEQWQKRWY